MGPVNMIYFAMTVWHEGFLVLLEWMRGKRARVKATVIAMKVDLIRVV